MNPRGRRQRLSNIQQIAETLRQSDDVVAPDLTSTILDAVDAERPFLSEKTRRMVVAGRFAIGFAVVCVVGAVALTNRLAPSLFELTSRPAPLSAVVETVQNEAQIKLADLQRQVQTVTVSAASTSPASAQVFYTLVAPKPAAGQAVAVSCCTMVGPMLPPAEAARRCCTEKAGLACCSARPLAGIAGLPGVPSQSSWNAMGSGTPSAELEDLDPLSLDSPIAPR